MNSKRIVLLLTVFIVLAPITAIGYGPFSPGAVYVMSNAPEGNMVTAFDRDVDGRLTLRTSYATGGLGTGGNIDPLGSQGSLILSSNKHWLLVANAGSDDVSVFRVRPHGLKLVGNFASGGPFPTSLTIHRNLVYVLNAGREGAGANIAGFTLNRKGKLTLLADSVRDLGPGSYHQVGFTPRGDDLVVTQQLPSGINNLLVFPVNEDGLPDASPVISPSEGIVPFGFIFDWRGHLLVAEAGSGAVSSYGLWDDGFLETISASVPNGNAATCWIAGTWRGLIFTANTGSDNISTYTLDSDNGEVHLKNANAATGDKPIDMAVTFDGRYLYVLNAGGGTVGAFRIERGGQLTELGTIAGLPPVYSQGIAVH